MGVWYKLQSVPYLPLQHLGTRPLEAQAVDGLCALDREVDKAAAFQTLSIIHQIEILGVGGQT